MAKRKYDIVPEYVYSDGDLAIEFAAQYGLVADEWQEQLVTEILGEDETGQYAAATFGYSIPRRNGKSVVTTIVSLYEMVVNGAQIIYTAHLTKSAMEQFEFIRYYFEQTDLKKMVKKTVLRTGSEGIYLTNGGNFRVFTRSTDSGRGSGCDRLWLDEAMRIEDGSLASLLPTIANSKKPGLCYLGTPSMVGDRRGKPFADLRANILEGKASKMAWVEYGAEATDDPNDPATWWTANPALETGRLTESYIETELSTGMTREEFLTERCGIWGAVKSTSIIDLQTWQSRGDTSSQIVGTQTLGVDVAPDLSTATISAAGVNQHGKWHVEKVHQRSGGIDWLAEALVTLCTNGKNDISAVVIDEQSVKSIKKREAASEVKKGFLDTLSRAGVTVIQTTMAQMGSACQEFYDSVMDDSLRHFGQPEITLALSLARKRKIVNGTAWAWQRASASTDLTPLVSVTLALYGARANHIAPQVKKKRGRIRSR